MDLRCWYGIFLTDGYIEVQRAHSRALLGEHKLATTSFDMARDSLPASYYHERGVNLARKALAHAGAAIADMHTNLAARATLEALSIGAETHSGRTVLS